MTTFVKSILDSATGAKLAVSTALAKGKVHGVIHINHGMSEHSGRFAHFADFLSNNGYHVVAHDHRGHGQTIAPDGGPGIYAISDGWEKVLTDVDEVVSHIAIQFPDLPRVILGHSMGCIIALNYCIRHSDKITAAALWNSGVDNGALMKIFRILVAVDRKLKPDTGQMAHKLSFEKWNSEFKPNRTSADWLTSDESEVDKYLADPMCGFRTTNAMWTDVLMGMKIAADDNNLKKIRADLPVHLLAGGKDPVTFGGSASERIANRMKKIGMEDITLKIYPENRHEALYEKNRDEVMSDFLAWVNDKLGAGKTA